MKVEVTSQKVSAVITFSLISTVSLKRRALNGSPTLDHAARERDPEKTKRQ